jgi:hypothetical protein
MNYPKMLYKGEPGYTDSAQMRDDLASRKIQTFIVQDEEQEAMRREQGWVDLADLMKKKPLLTLPTLNSLLLEGFGCGGREKAETQVHPSRSK